MSNEGRQPAPEFDDTRYERPQKDWLCGHACEGCPCRLGPSPSGDCRAGPQCKPLLVAPEGESKGLWKCTRSADWGGPCPTGPNPDGTCCQVTPPCAPVRSLRSRRGLLVRLTLAACFGLILVILYGPWREAAINPGPLTPVHSGPAFAAAHSAAGVNDTQGCVHCHTASHRSPGEWLSTAAASLVPGAPLAPTQLISREARDFDPMDAACQSCHQPHSFHQASVANDTSCSACHLEHQGRGQNLLAVNPSHCTACHGDNSKMADAAALARRLDPALFTKKIADGSVAFAVARPPEGLTARITSFATDHPEFRLHAPGTIDPNPLAFDHALHLTGEAIPLLDGKRLDCRSCHVPDQSGALMQPVRFALHCQSCHDLPIDPATPSLVVPHGSAEAARAFLRALSAAYSDDAVQRLGLSGAPLRAHVTEKLDALHLLHPSGEALERKVFFGDPSAPAGRDSCSLCHVVEAAPAGATPRIAPARVPDIWMPHARFDHARHTQVACVACHAATTSVLTTDVLMPAKATCASCHSPAGGVTDSCTACHGYHNPPPTGVTKTAYLPDQLKRALASAP